MFKTWILKANSFPTGPTAIDGFPIASPYPMPCLDLNGKGDTLHLGLRDANAVAREVHSHLEGRMAYSPVHGTGKSYEWVQDVQVIYWKSMSATVYVPFPGLIAKE